MNLYYLHFNNYYNRIVKKFDTLSEYLVLPYYDNVVTNSIAFNPNDGVQTKQVANVPVGNEFTYDYCILAEGNDIISRWFILDANRNRNGQYSLTLRRDMFADSYEPVLDAPALIEKATLGANDPMIFNSENMTFNQIKQSETLLKDSSGCPWIVGYLANDSVQTKQDVNYKLPEPYANVSDFESIWNVNKSSGLGDRVVFKDPNFKFKVYIENSSSPKQFIIPTDVYDIGYVTSTTIGSVLFTNKNDATLNKFRTLIRNNLEDLKEILNTNYNLASYNEIEKILEYNGKILYDENTNKYYKVNISLSSSGGYGNDNLIISALNMTPDLFSKLLNITQQNEYVEGTNNVSVGNNPFSIDLVSNFITKELIEVSAETVYYEITKSVNKLSDAPYTMFAIPYGACNIKYIENAEEKTINIDDSNGKSIAMAVAFDIIERKGGKDPELYDIQLLPYCPLQNNIDAEGNIYLNIDSYYTLITDSEDNPVSLITFPIESRFTFNIPYNIKINNTKVESQCDMYRMCSPNWNGQFEFNAAKNGGVNTINVDCEYKPFQPYIHLNPNFNLLYGKDFNDARGLICNGDFSLTQISDAWATYQRQNVNYDKQFNRQIQNMEINNNIQMLQAEAQAILGTSGGVLGGFMAGGIGGAVAGGVSSAIGGAMDVGLLAASQAEAIDYTKDQFGYSLGNIKALPDSLTKVSAFNNNNKIFPVIEYYTCTDEEKQALENKMKYNGMTVMRIGTIREFLKSEKSYIKGKLIRLENFNEDFHYVNELANEFNKGVFI